jgi:xanthosine phosphorylase
MINFNDSANIIKQIKPNFQPKFGIILGSGLGSVAKQITDATIIPYSELSNFPKCATQGHSGQLYLGYIHKVPVVCFQGRAHLYEGTAPIIIKNFIRTLKLLGCDALILTCACGSLNSEILAGSLAMITDHINFQFANVLIGPNDEEFGPRFPSLDGAYDAELREKFIQIAKKLYIPLGQGVYIASSGPSYETHAEIRAFRTLGADFAGMSTVPDVMIARHCGLKIAAIAAITNMAAGLQAEPLSHEEVLLCSHRVAKDITKLLLAFFEHQ